MSKIKITIISIISLAVLALALFNIYYFGSNYFMRKGAQIVIGQIIQQVEQTNQVQINQNLILIKK